MFRLCKQGQKNFFFFFLFWHRHKIGIYMVGLRRTPEILFLLGSNPKLSNPLTGRDKGLQTQPKPTLLRNPLYKRINVETKRVDVLLLE